MININKKEFVYEEIKKRIIKGEIPSGYEIIEEYLSKELGVSKTPIREALRQLETAGLVKNIPGKGTKVVEITYEYIVETFEIRAILECGAARILSQSHNKTGLIKIREEFKNKISKELSDKENIYEWEFFEEMHLAIVNAVRNKILSETYEKLMDRILKIKYNLGRRFVEMRFNEIVEEHLEILDSIIKGDAENAEKMMQQHLSNALKSIMLFTLERER